MADSSTRSSTPPSANPAAPPAAVFGKREVCEAFAGHPAIRALEALLTDAKWDRRELTLSVAPQTIVDVARALKAVGYNFLEDVTAVDWYPTDTPSAPRFQVSYSFLSHRLKERVRVIARVMGDNPRIHSITSVWPSANFYEREVFDLFGIQFAGHPNLTRIMMPDNWNGHPLRKDYPVEGYRS
ncbi:MAG: NADH-quinone oxidoreductase subunit C [Acidobacteriaceae bacterium]